MFQLKKMPIMNLFSFKIKKIFFFIGILIRNAATQAQDVLDFVAINDYVTTPLDANYK